jgi:hypothetical protein
MKKKLFLFFILLVSSLANAQVFKRYQPATLWNNIHINCKLSDKEEIVTHFSFRRPFNSQYLNSIANNVPLDQFSFFHFFAGYQYQTTPHWILHGSVRYRVENIGATIHTLVPRLMAGHIGIHKNFRFTKQVIFERFQDLSQSANSFNQFRFLFGFSNQFKINESKLTPIVSIEIFKNAPKIADNQPMFSKTRLRFDVIYDINPKFGIGVFAMRNTRYDYLLGSYNEFGEILTPKGRYNRITPIYGLQLFFKLKKGDIFPITY